MGYECFQLHMFMRSCQLSQLVSLVIDFSNYMNHLNFFELFPESFKCEVVLQELGVSEMKHFVYLCSDDLGITPTLTSLASLSPVRRALYSA